MKTVGNTPTAATSGMVDDTAHQRLVAFGVTAEVRADVLRSALAAFSPELQSCFERRARAQDAAATPPPIDPEHSLADRWLLGSITAGKNKEAEASARVMVTRENRDKARQASTLVLKHWNWGIRLAVIGAVLGLTLLAIYPVMGLLAPALDYYVLRSVLTSVRDDALAQSSAEQARWIAACLAGMLLFGQSVTVIVNWGTGRFMKFFLICEVIFSLAFGLVRMGPESSSHVCSLSVFELATLAGFGAALFGIGRRLGQDRETAERYRLARSVVDMAELTYQEALDEHAVAQRDQEAREARIARREDAVRQHTAHQELMAASALTEYAVTLSELISKSVPSELSEQFWAQLPEHLRRVFVLNGTRR